MELDLVDTVAPAVVGPQPRRVLVGLEAPPDRVAAREDPELLRPFARPPRSLALEPRGERTVLGEQVVREQRGDLVEDRVRWR